MLEPDLQFIFLWLFWKEELVNYLPGLASNLDLPDLASQVARITGRSP
jgi:hypothetical protein